MYRDTHLVCCAVTLLQSDPVPKSANSLITVPGGTEGPGGVLVLCEDTIIWKGLNETDEAQALIPRSRLSHESTNSKKGLTFRETVVF